MKSLVILAMFAAPAIADERLDNAVSVQLATLAGTGIALEGEHDLGMHELSIVGSLGARAAARGDFDSRSFGAGVELRRWLRRPTTMQGLYVGGRIDLARTSVDMMDRAIGSLTTGTVTATIGYRFVITRAIEITPSFGVATIVEGGGMIPTTMRRTAVIGLTAGWIF